MARGDCGEATLTTEVLDTTNNWQDEIDGRPVKYVQHNSLLDYDDVDVSVDQQSSEENTQGYAIHKPYKTSPSRSLSQRTQSMRERVRSMNRELSRESRKMISCFGDFVNSSKLQKFLVLIPILSGTLPPVFIGISLIVASSQGNLFKDPEKNFVPYISDIGNYKPQSSVFTFGLSLSCLCTFITIIVRYQQGVLLFRDCTKRANLIACVIGCTLVLGKFLVASFQLSSSQVVHYLAAVLYVFSAVLYCVIQTFISYLNKKYHTKTRIYLRGFLVTGMTLGALIFLIFLSPPLHRFNRGSLSVAQAGEWTFAALKMAFFISFCVDFMQVKLHFSLESNVLASTEDFAQKNSCGGSSEVVMQAYAQDDQIA